MYIHNRYGQRSKVMKDTFILLTLMLLIMSCTDNKGTGSRAIVENNSPPYAGPIIDMHVHAYNEASPSFGREMVNPLTDKVYMGSESLQKHQEETFAKFEQYNIVKAVVSQYAYEWHQIDSSLILFGRNHHNSVSDLRSQYSQGKLDVLGEVAPNYDGILPNDESLTKYFDLAVELDIPVGYHMYPGGPPGGAYFAYPKTRAHQGKPLKLEEILFSRPSMRIYIMHAGWSYLEDMKALMYAHPQVFVDLAVINWALPRKEFHKFLQGLVDAGFGKRIMFGSDQMEWPVTMDEAIEAVNSANFLTIDQKADIFYNNAARFLELSSEEIEQHKTQINP